MTQPKKDIVVKVGLRRDDARWLKQAAREADLSVSAYLRHLLNIERLKLRRLGEPAE